jgi:hypothetical protein
VEENSARNRTQDSANSGQPTTERHIAFSDERLWRASAGGGAYRQTTQVPRTGFEQTAFSSENQGVLPDDSAKCSALSQMPPTTPLETDEMRIQWESLSPEIRVAVLTLMRSAGRYGQNE